MVKKLAALAGAGALLLGAAVPVFAGHWGGSSDVAIISNSATAVANTGMNGQGNTAAISGGNVDDTNVSGNNSMSTGNASAYAGALVVANTHIGCGCDGVGGEHWGGGSRHNDFALVNNSAVASANTGDNGQGNLALITSSGHHHHGGNVDDTTVSGNNSMSTGAASSTARAWTIVNTHWGD